MRVLTVLLICAVLLFSCAGLPEKDTSYSYGGLPMDDPLRQTDEFKAGHADPIE